MTALRVYVAGASAEPERVRWAMDAVRDAGAAVTLDWLAPIEAGVPANTGLSDAERRQYARADLDAVVSSDVLWLLAPEAPSAGAWVELGHALRCHVVVIVSGPARKRSIFAALAVECDTDADALELVRGLAADQNEVASRRGNARGHGQP